MRASVTNVTAAPVEAEIGMHLGGAARTETVAAHRLGAAADSPSSCRRWSRGRGGGRRDGPRAVGPVHRLRRDAVRLAGPAAREAAAELRLRPAAGRAARRPRRHAGRRSASSPGFADPAGDQRWTARTSIRRLCRHVGRARAAPTAPRPPSPRKATATATFALPESPGRSPRRFVPLGLLVARADGRSWTREVELASPGHGARAMSAARRSDGADRGGAGVLGRLARGAGAPGARRPDRLPDDGLPGRSDDVHHAEAEVARSRRPATPATSCR